MISSNTPENIARPVLVLVGPTAIGKTALSLELCEAFSCEIISVDSMQVYRYMDIGTAKLPETERRSIPHHLIDIVNPDEQYDAARFTYDCLQAIKDIHERSAIPLLTGGTGLYLRALKNGLFDAAPGNPEVRAMLQARMELEGINKLHDYLFLCDRISAGKIHINDTYRILRALEVFLSTGIPLSTHQQQTTSAACFSNMLTIGLTDERASLYERINLRSLQMIEGGFEEEVRRLLDMGYSPALKPMQSIGYRHMLNYIDERWTKDELLANLARDTRRYAKRQYTWFTRDTSVAWFNRNDEKKVILQVDDWLQRT